MIKTARYLAYLFLIAFIFSCNSNNGTTVVIHTRAPIGAKLYIKTVPYFSEKEEVVDSATIVNNHDSLILHLPQQEQRLFRIVTKDQYMRVTFINDAKLVHVYVDYFKKKYTVTGSAATTSLIDFENSQVKLADELKKLSKPLDSLNRLHIKGAQTDTLSKKYYSAYNSYLKRYISYDDTVKNAAAFILEYNNIDFDTDYKGLKKFITHNAARFPGSKTIQQIKAKALAMVRIYEEEFNVGDILPGITLPDTNGKPFSTSSLKGQYYLIDFWSTWCDRCMTFKIAEKDIVSGGKSKVNFVSVAIDDQKDNWKSLISKTKLKWVNLIDEKMWEGTAVNTLVFDSIPFNFLVNPQGKVIKKAIRADSLKQTLTNLKLD